MSMDKETAKKLKKELETRLENLNEDLDGIKVGSEGSRYCVRILTFFPMGSYISREVNEVIDDFEGHLTWILTEKENPEEIWIS